MTMQAYTPATFFGSKGWLIVGNERTLDQVPEKFPVDPSPSLFDPTPLGFRRPFMPRTTSCWCGFQYGVSIDTVGLLLEWVALSHDEGVPYPVINGKKPTLVDEIFEARYENIGLGLKYTGVIRLGRETIKGLRSPMYGLPPYLFHSVIDVELNAGAFVNAWNRSQHFEDFRALHRDAIERTLSSLDHLGLSG